MEFVIMAGKGGGAVAKQLAGKHADSTVNNPSETEGFYKAGKVVALLLIVLPIIKAGYDRMRRKPAPAG